MNQILSPEEFRERREYFRISQAKVARELGLKRSYISQFENGRYRFSDDELLQLRSFLEDCHHDFEEDDVFDQDPVPVADEEPESAGIDESLNNIHDILSRPVPKYLVFFDDDDELAELRQELLRECLSVVKVCAKANNQLLGDWEDSTIVASRI